MLRVCVLYSLFSLPFSPLIIFSLYPYLPSHIDTLTLLSKTRKVARNHRDDTVGGFHCVLFVATWT